MEFPSLYRLPLKLIDLHDCVWSSHDISLDCLAHPEIRRAIDDEPVCVELLMTGRWFVHDGRHRILRALARGEHQGLAWCYSKSDLQ